MTSHQHNSKSKGPVLLLKTRFTMSSIPTDERTRQVFRELQGTSVR